jgi:hypothetical protein
MPRMLRVLLLGLGVSVFSACSSSDDSGDGAGAGGGSGGSAASGGTVSGGAGGGSAGTSAGGSAGTSSFDTWGNHAQGFFATYCIECHGAGDAQRDYSTIDDVIRDQEEIACGVSPVALPGCGSFPPPKQFPIDNATNTNPKPNDTERSRLVAWIEAGLPE